MGVAINLIKNMAVNKDDITQIKKSLQELRKGQLEILLKLEVKTNKLISSLLLSLHIRTLMKGLAI